MGTALPDVTGLLVALNDGDETARTRLIEAVHSELRRLARGFMGRVRWQNRAHFFAVAAHQMRRILLDHARAHHARKRGGGACVPLVNQDVALAPLNVDLLALDAALLKLGSRYPRQAQLIELRFFGGLTVEETAAVLGVAPITVKRDWALAKAWLYREVQGQPA